MRLRRGMSSKLVGFSVRHIDLPESDKAVLMVTESLHGRGHSESDMARTAVDCLDGFSHASAILGPKGELLASSKHYGTLDISDGELKNLVNEVSNEEDRLVKRLITTVNGSVAAGIARLSDDPANHMLIIADADVDSNQTEPSSTESDDEGEQSPPPVEQIADAETEETVQSSGPVVGAFSNRRRGGKSGVARWYFKQPPEEEDVKPDAVSEVSAEVETEGAVETPETAESVDEAAAPSDVDQDEASNESFDLPTDDHPVQNGGLIQETTYTDGSTSDAERNDSEDEWEQSDTDAAQNTLQPVIDNDFEFTAGPKPIRFVWDMDTNNEFRSISSEFADAVGPNAANIVGLTWSELCQMHEIENGEDVSVLLRKGDTWSGKTVLWPVEGTDLRVPIDLAGLPSYGRNRSFEGFNGFGIVRTADAVVDPHASGLKLTPLSENTEPLVAEDSPQSEEQPRPEDQSSQTTKVVDLQSRRDSSSERSLSSDEQETFEEIGEKLGDDQHASSNNDDGETKSPDTDSQTEEFTPAAFSGPSRRSLDSPEGPETTANAVSTPDHTVDTSILARLPIPVLVYRENELLFGNQQFFQQTGYEDLQNLAQAGGIEVLFGEARSEGAGNRSTIYHANGKQLDAQANLQRVPWDDDRAMLLTLRHNQSGDGDNDPNFQGEQVGNNTDESPDDGSGDGGESDQSSSATKDELAGAKSRQADIVSLHGDAMQPDQTTRPAFGGLGAEDLRDILDTATDGVVILTDEGIVKALNKSAEALFDVKPADVLDQSFTRILALESHRSALDYLSGISGTGVASLMNDGREIIGKTTKGGLIPLFMTIGKLQQTDACCAVVRDITQWKKAEEELLNAKSIAESASAQKTEFLAKVSHEIRTPLNAIIGFSDMMIEERFGEIDNDRYRGYLRDIHRSGNHVLELVNDLLDISKIEAGKMELEFDACDLNTTVSETVALTQPDANKERIIIRTSLSAVVPKIVADPRSLRQIILNLVSNSIKFTKPGGQVIVSTVYEESGEVVLRVRDTGIGMSDMELARALKPFQQVNTEIETQGTGLGLPLTKAMVEANRARFEIESNPEEGTLVEIYFPNQRVLADR
ncbi:MAG: PAS domain S-box protein [Rhizobiaceae bacterium]|nr:PAS domain S-box protein [Rhizobiaceae bacterium]